MAASMRASVVISNYNYGQYLHQCIDSALAQTVSAQVVIVDDASTDDSVDIIRSYGDHIDFIPFSVNRGFNGALTAGMEAATGDVVLFLDSDDWMLPQRVERVVDVFGADSSIGAVRHDARVVDATGNPISDQWYAYSTNSDPATDLLLFGLTLGSTGCIALLRSFLTEIGPIPDDCHADYYLLTAASIAQRLDTIYESLTVRRFHAAQQTSLFRTQRSMASRMIDFSFCKAADAAELAQRLGGPPALATGSTWWQQKAMYEHSKATGHDRWLPSWLRHLALTSRAPIPTKRRIGEVGRSVALGVLPKRVFSYARWRTHEGRPAVRMIDAVGTHSLLSRSPPRASSL